MAVVTETAPQPARVVPPPSRWRARVRSGRLDPFLVALVGAAIAFAFSWVPSLWFDEAATVVAAERSWGALGRMIGTVDMVHATYYAFMHLWFDVIPYSPVSLRLPSVLATGAAAGLTVVLGRVLINRRVGLVAGLLFCLLPRVTWMGGEGRSFAIVTMLGVATTLLLVVAWRRTVAGVPSKGWWIAYTAVAVLVSFMFLYAALIIVSHGVTIALGALHRQNGRRGFLRWLTAAAVAALVCVPLAFLSSEQATQISWIKKPALHTFYSVFATQWFSGNLLFAWFAWALVLVSLVVIAVRHNRFRVEALALVLPLVVVPTVGLVGISLVHTPLYSPRYLTMGAPYIAILMAIGIASLRWKSGIAVVVAGAVALSIPTIVEQRQLEAKDESAWNQVADLIITERAAEPAGTVGAVVYGPVRRHPAAKSRIIADTYPAAFEGLRDPTLKASIEDVDGLWEKQYPLEDVIDQFDGVDTVWLVTSDKQDWRPRVTADLEAEGFHVDTQWHLSKTNIVRYER